MSLCAYGSPCFRVDDAKRVVYVQWTTCSTIRSQWVWRRTITQRWGYVAPFRQRRAAEYQNAVVMAEPHAPFIERWLVGYQDFRKHIYEYNGVIKPLVRLVCATEG